METENDSVNVVNPEGKLVSIAPSELPTALNQNYREATPEDITRYQTEAKYNTTGQQLASVAEGLASGASFGLSKPISHKLGITSPEATLAREEYNPGLEMLGEGASLLIPGVGPQKLLGAAGKGVAKAVGLGAEAIGESAIKKIGSEAVKAASENAIFQMGHETGHVASLFAAHPDTDPSEAVQTAIGNIGLAAVLGGGIGGGVGAVNPLWKATSGAKVSEFLGSLVKKAAGVEGQVPNVLENEIRQSGIEIAPEIMAGISGDPHLAAMYQTLKESSAKAGIKTQEALKNFRTDASNSALQSFGKKANQVLSKSDISEAATGKNIGETLHRELEAKSGPISQQFEKLRGKYKNVELPKGEIIPAVPEQFDIYGTKIANATPESALPSFTDSLGDKIIGMADQEGWATMADSDIMRSVNKVVKNLPRQKTLNDLKNFIQQVGNDTFNPLNPQLTRAGSMMKNILRDAESELILQKLGSEGPELVSEYRGAQEAWKSAAKLKDALDERLHVGGGDSIGSFLKNLKNMSSTDGEAVLRRLSGKGDASLLPILSNEFPETASAIKKYHLDDILGRSVDKAAEGEAINVRELSKAINKMSPELRSFAIDAQSHARVEALDKLMEAASKKMNSSGTAKTMDALWSYIPATATGLISMVASGNPIVGATVGALTKFIGRDAPDAIRLSLLKFLGSNQPIEAEGFKAMVDMIQQTMKGENLLSKGTKAVFKSGQEVLPQAFMPTEKQRQSLEKQLTKLRDNPEPLTKIGGKAGYYLPDNIGALAQTAASVLNQLNSMRPSPTKQSPLDSDPVVPKSQKQEYDRALDIAEQPLVVLEDIKNGTITPKDIQLLSSLYPALYKRVSNKLQTEMIEAVNDGVNIPYKTRMGLSLFVGQPLDSTMLPQNIMAAQPIVQAPPQQQKPNGTSVNSLNKLPPMYATGPQSREANKMMK